MSCSPLFLFLLMFSELVVTVGLIGRTVNILHSRGLSFYM